MISWNVNGIRSVLKKGFAEFIKGDRADIYCIQESRAKPDQVDLDLSDYEQIWNPAEKGGYSGTLILSKIKPDKITHGIGLEEGDREGRVITAEFGKFFLVNVYTPNSGEGLTRLEFRQQWDEAFRKYLNKLDKKKPVIFCGDLNVAHKEIDLKNPAQNRKNAGFTDEEREGFTGLLESGFIDSFRKFNQEGGNYSWWSYRLNARSRNAGWRIDYFGVSQKLDEHLKKAFILSDVMGSDHCPVGVEMDL